MLCLMSSIAVLPVLGQDEMIFQSDFEKNTRKWEKRGAVIGRTKKEAASGDRSLRVSGRSETWQGAQINVSSLLKKQQAYEFTVSVKLAQNEKPDVIRMNMERGNNNFSGIGAVEANADVWKTVSGKFTPNGRDPYLLVFIEAGRANTSYYLDDFKIVAASLIPKQEGVLVKNDFENFTSQGWYAFGNGVQMYSSKPLKSSRGIRVAGRSAPEHGVAVDLSPKFFTGRTYTMSIGVRMVKGQPSDSLRLGVQQTAPDGKKTFVEVAPYKEATDSEWVTLSGDYKVTTERNNLLVVVQAKGATSSFLIDNFELARKTLSLTPTKRKPLNLERKNNQE